MNPQKKYLLAILILTIKLLQLCQPLKNKAIVFNAGKFFYNYRMEVNIFTILNILREKDFSFRDVS